MGASPSEPVDGAYTTPRGRRIAADAVKLDRLIQEQQA